MSKLKILLVSANAIQGATLRVDAEFKAVQQQLGQTADVRYVPSATWEEVAAQVEGYTPRVVHFSAHGGDSEEILLTTREGRPHPIPTKALEQLFKVMRGKIRLVVMNSCFSERQARAIAKFTDGVLGVKLRLPEEVALGFSPRFYKAISEGESVAEAYERAMVLVYSARPEKHQIPRYHGRVPADKLKLVPIKRPHTKSKPKPTLVPGPDLEAAETEESSSPSPASFSIMSCQSLIWDVKIDEEGDANNELAYAGIVLPPGRPYVFKLPAAEVQSGHTSQFELTRDNRTIADAHLREVEISPTKVHMNVEFDNRPTVENPGRFVLSCWDWNVYAMNLEEFRQKPHFSETHDGVDYAQKFVPESWANFTLAISFPSQMEFDKSPYFEVYYPAKAAEKGRNDELTQRYRNCFHYTPVSNQARLTIQRPQSPFLYRISWQLGQGKTLVASPLTGIQRQKQRRFTDRLAEMKHTLDAEGIEKSAGVGLEALQLREIINSVLVSFAAWVEELLKGAELDTETLEVSLMVLDEKYKEKSPTNRDGFPVLRIVAGTLLREKAYRDLYFFVGDGNAGRAWKHRMARIYDWNDESNPKRHIYKTLPGAFRHRFLISVPLIDPRSTALIYGILNLGTSSEDQAELLRKFGKKPGIEKLTDHAQTYVLKRLKELIRVN